MPLKILAKNKTEAEVYIYDAIGDFWGEGVTAKDFVRELNALKVDTIHAHINSPGGNVFDGTTIYNALRNHKARISVHVDGLAASAASYIAMAGDEISMADNAFMMIHHPWTFVAGNAADLRKAADDLSLLSDVYVDAYAKRARGKSSRADIVAFMDVETWLTAESAVSAGLADTITEQLEMAAKFDLARYKYKNIPAKVVDKMALPKEAARRARLASMNMAVMRIKPSAATGRA